MDVQIDKLTKSEFIEAGLIFFKKLPLHKRNSIIKFHKNHLHSSQAHQDFLFDFSSIKNNI